MPDRLEELMKQAVMTPVSSGEVDAPFEFAGLESALHGLLSAGAAVAIIERVGAEPVQRTLTEALAPFRTDAGGYRLRNTFHYVIATVD